MSKKQKKPPGSVPRAANKMGLWIAVAVLVFGGVAVAFLNSTKKPGSTAAKSGSTPTSTNATSSSQSETNGAVMEINQAVMVTVELDFGPKVPTIAEALQEIERRYQPDDGVGRTFAILDAYGETTPAGLLHISMHVSTEKPGMGTLIFKRTGKALWQSRIVPLTNSTAKTFTGKNLTIYMDNGSGQLLTVDGSSNPGSILEATIKEASAPVGLLLPDGTEREFTFIYSACGCPVKAMVKRAGDRTVRTKEMPVMFPDDPAVVQVISNLMRW